MRCIMGQEIPKGYYDKENNYILETEHGPHGGDEINLIKVNKIDKIIQSILDGQLYLTAFITALWKIIGVEDCDLITKKYPTQRP